MRSTHLLSLIFAVILTVPTFAHADWGYRRDHRTYRGPTYGYPSHPFPQTYPTYPTYHPQPTNYWRAGRWEHRWHDNRYGWWWVNGLGFNFYSAPVYPYPDPVETQTTIIYEPQPTVSVAQPAAPVPPPSTAPIPGSQTPPNNGLYYFCESSQLYYPYARSCSERWKTVPQAPVD